VNCLQFLGLSVCGRKTTKFLTVKCSFKIVVWVLKPEDHELSDGEIYIKKLLTDVCGILWLDSCLGARKARWEWSGWNFGCEMCSTGLTGLTYWDALLLSDVMFYRYCPNVHYAARP